MEIRNQTINDPVSGLTIKFEDGRMSIFGDPLPGDLKINNRDFFFMVDGKFDGTGMSLSKCPIRAETPCAKLQLRKYDDGKYSICVHDLFGKCHINKAIDKAEFDHAFAFYVNDGYDVVPVDDNGCSEELYEVKI